MAVRANVFGHKLILDLHTRKGYRKVPVIKSEKLKARIKKVRECAKAANTLEDRKKCF